MFRALCINFIDSLCPYRLVIPGRRSVILQDRPLQEGELCDSPSCLNRQLAKQLVCAILPNLSANTVFFPVELVLLSLGDVAAVGILVSAFLPMNTALFASQLAVMSAEVSFERIGAAAQVAVAMQNFGAARMILSESAGMRGHI